MHITNDQILAISEESYLTNLRRTGLVLAIISDGTTHAIAPGDGLLFNDNRYILARFFEPHTPDKVRSHIAFAELGVFYEPAMDAADKALNY